LGNRQRLRLIESVVAASTSVEKPDTGGEFTAPIVVLQPGESQESLVRRFRNKVMRDGILREAKRKRHFVSKSEKRRIAERKAIRRIRKRQWRDQQTRQG